jgi:ABC-type transporter Mla subunit MlaD
MFDVVSMWSYYTHQGVWFFLAHLVVLATIVHLWWFQILRQTKALEWWPERSSPESRAASILNQFVEECRKLGPRGIAVPMSDFADRLDSHVAVYIDRLHSRVNLFLIVGVAGTFYAMFSFVTKIGGDGADVSKALRDGLTQAFPIGFFGLVWTFLGHYGAFIVEERLRKALNGATQRAMKVRADHLQTPLDQLALALEPLKDLQATLQQTLAPVIEGFREELKTASTLMGEQVQPLAAAVQEFHKAAAELSGPTERLAEVAQGMPRILEGIARLQQEVATVVGGMASTSEETRTNLSAAAEQLSSAAAAIRALPSQLATETSLSLARVHENVCEIWSSSSGKFFAELEPVREALVSAGAALGSAGAMLAEMPGRIEGQTAESLQALTDKVTGMITDAVDRVAAAAHGLDKLCGNLGGAAGAMTQAFEQQCASLARQSAEAWRNASETFLRDVGNRAEAHWAGIRSASQQAATQLHEAARELVTTSNAVDQILKKSLEEIYQQAAQQARPHLERLERTVTYQYPLILNNLGQAAQHSSTVAGNVERVQQELKLSGDHVQAAGQAFKEAARRLEELLAMPGRNGEVLGELRKIHGALGTIEAHLRPRSKPKGSVQKIWDLLKGRAR